MLEKIEIRYQISPQCLLNCDFCTIRNSKLYKYGCFGTSANDVSFEALKKVISACRINYPDVPISIGYYEEPLLHQDMIMKSLTYFKDVGYITHLLKSSGVQTFDNDFYNYIDTRDDVYVDFGLKEKLHPKNIVCLNRSPRLKNGCKYTMTMVYYPISYDSCMDFYIKYKTFERFFNTRQLRISLGFSFDYSEDVDKYYKFTNYIHGACNLFNIYHRHICRSSGTVCTIFIRPNGSIMSEVPFKIYDANYMRIKFVKSEFNQLPNSCQCCPLFNSCGVIKNLLYRRSDGLENFCKLMSAIHHIEYNRIPTFEDFEYETLIQKYNNIHDHSTYLVYEDYLTR